MSNPTCEFYVIDYGDGTYYKESTAQRGRQVVTIADSTSDLKEAHLFEWFADADIAIQDYLEPHLALKSSIKKLTITLEDV